MGVAWVWTDKIARRCCHGSASNLGGGALILAAAVPELSSGLPSYRCRIAAVSPRRVGEEQEAPERLRLHKVSMHAFIVLHLSLYGGTDRSLDSAGPLQAAAAKHTVRVPRILERGTVRSSLVRMSMPLWGIVISFSASNPFVTGMPTSPTTWFQRVASIRVSMSCLSRRYMLIDHARSVVCKSASTTNVFTIS